MSNQPQESDPLLRSQSTVIPDSAEEGGESQKTATKSTSYFSRLDMLPSARDKTAFGLVIAGLALFLPITWYMVFSNDLKVSFLLLPLQEARSSKLKTGQ